MDRHKHEANNNQVDEIFRFPTREELRQKKEREQARIQESKAVVTNYKQQDLSGCLSGSLSGSLKTPQKSTDRSKSVVTNYKDEDLSGCLSGALNAQPTKVKTSQRDRFVPTQRNVKTGEITSIEEDDLSKAIDSLSEEKSGWLYFN